MDVVPSGYVELMELDDIVVWFEPIQFGILKRYLSNTLLVDRSNNLK
jgi:hypothetical protein